MGIVGTKNNPAPFDCYANAEPDEPIFVLLARDPAASRTLQRWANLRVALGKNELDDAQITEALACAQAMETWRAEHRS